MIRLDHLNFFRYGYHKKCHVYPREECHDIPIKHPVKVPLGKFIDKIVKFLFCLPETFNKLNFKFWRGVPRCTKNPLQESPNPGECYTSLFDSDLYYSILFQIPHESCKSVPDKQCIEESTSIFPPSTSVFITLFQPQILCNFINYSPFGHFYENRLKSINNFCRFRIKCQKRYLMRFDYFRKLSYF